MVDNKRMTDNRDRLRVAGGEDYEVQYLMQQARISAGEARDLIKKYGNDREILVHIGA